MKELIAKLKKALQPKPEVPLDVQILDAQTQLSLAKKKLSMTVAMELNAIRSDRAKNINKGFEAGHFTTIKRACYLMSVIDVTKTQLKQVENSIRFYDAINGMAAAMNQINRISRKSPKPKINMFKHQSKLLESRTQAMEARMDKAFGGITSINELVPDATVESMINGEQLEACLQRGDAFTHTPDTLPGFLPMDDGIDWITGEETGSSGKKIAQEADLGEMDFTGMFDDLG